MKLIDYLKQLNLVELNTEIMELESLFNINSNIVSVSNVVEHIESSVTPSVENIDKKEKELLLVQIPDTIEPLVRKDLFKYIGNLLSISLLEVHKQVKTQLPLLVKKSFSNEELLIHKNELEKLGAILSIN